MTKWLLGMSLSEIHSLRFQNNTLQARLDVLVEERDRLRQELIEARRDETGVLKHIVDAMRHDSGLVSAFASSPQPVDPPRGDVSRMTSMRAESMVQKANRRFTESHVITPNTGWNDPPEDTPQEPN